MPHAQVVTALLQCFLVERLDSIQVAPCLIRVIAGCWVSSWGHAEGIATEVPLRGAAWKIAIQISSSYLRGAAREIAMQISSSYTAVSEAMLRATEATWSAAETSYATEASWSAAAVKRWQSVATVSAVHPSANHALGVEPGVRVVSETMSSSASESSTWKS